MKEFVCPSNGNQLYQHADSLHAPRRFTNYKAMGASCKKPGDGRKSDGHGALWHRRPSIPTARFIPGTNLPAAQILDGLSHTIFLMETIDNTASRWMFGSECVLTGLPGRVPVPDDASVPTGTTPRPTAITISRRRATR